MRRDGLYYCMSRLRVLTIILAVGGVSPAFADESSRALSGQMNQQGRTGDASQDTARTEAGPRSDSGALSSGDRGDSFEDNDIGKRSNPFNGPDVDQRSNRFNGDVSRPETIGGQ